MLLTIYIVCQVMLKNLFVLRSNFFLKKNFLLCFSVHMVMRMYHTVNLRRGLIQHFMFEAKQTVMQNDKYINDNI